MAVPEIKHVDPVPASGEYDIDGVWQAYEVPQYDLFAEALGTDGQIHMVHVRASFEAVDQLLDKMHEMIEHILKNRMKGLGVWE